MAICSYCQHPNREGAFYCRQCGKPVACPRCRVVLDQPLNYCDNCSQPLSLEAAFEIIPPARHDYAPIETNAYPQTVESSTPAEVFKAKEREQPVTRLDRFVPKEFMTKLEAARSSGTMVGERRVVTILFCDVAGSTSAAEQLDPEDWTEIINGAFEHMIRPVYDYEGTVARLTGDGILAFFGAPISHEDDPQRAVMAGLDIISSIERYKEKVSQEWNIDFNVRVGINTGRVVVGAVGSDLRMEYTAMGDAINLAARMEQSAALGTVQVAEHTYRLVSPLFDFEELGGIQVKGKSQPVMTYKVLGRKKSRGRLRGIEGLEIEMIGRDRELGELESALDLVQRGIGGIVCVIGEAGLGKSRLIRELRKKYFPHIPAEDLDSSVSVEAFEQGSGLSLRWFETSSLSFETAQPYSLFRRLIRRVCGIGDNDLPDMVREKLLPIVEQFEEPQKDQALSVLEALFSLQGDGSRPSLEGEAFKRALFEFMPTMWRRRFEGRPSVIVCDDLHWSDPASVSLLHDLLSLTEELAIVLICVFRPQRDVPGWQIKISADAKYRHRYTEVNLHPLSLEESNQMINALLGDPELPAELRQKVLERAEGNPFFIEEVIRTLIDGGALIPGERTNGHHKWLVAANSGEIVIPDNLQALLTARIDNLSEDVRQTLQVASVIGKFFYHRVLKMINQASTEIDQHIHTLLKQDLIRESARLPEMEYRFRNPLTQEAAYRTILLKRRREYHLRVGEVMESLFAEQLDEVAPRLAHHFQEAHQYQRAMYHFRQAGDEAFRLFANEEAVTHYGLALEMARKTKDGVSSADFLHLYMRRGRALEHLVNSRAALEHYQAMLEHGESADLPELRLEAMNAMATILSTQTQIQDIDRAFELANQALDLAKELGDRPAESKAYWNLLNTVAFADGDLEPGVFYGEQSLAIARELGLKEQVAFTLNGLIMVYWKNNMVEDAAARIEEVRSLWRELDNQPMLADSYTMTAFFQMLSGRYRESIETSRELERISLAINNHWNLTSSQVFQANASFGLGLIDQGLNYVKRTSELTTQPGLRGTELLSKGILLGVYILFEKIDRATELADELFASVDEMRFHDRPMVLGLVCSTYILSGDISKANEILDLMSEFDADAGNVFYVSYVVESRAEFALLADRPEEALRIAAAHIDRCKETGIFPPLLGLLYVKAKAHMMQGDPSSALQSLESAIAVSENIENRLYQWKLLAQWVAIAKESDLASEERFEEIRAKAVQEIEFISGNISDANLLDSFRSMPPVAMLLASTVAD